ncbi:MAG: hypothetical protein ACQ9MH_02275 [Nitrospinales bacterium]
MIQRSTLVIFLLFLFLLWPGINVTAEPTIGVGELSNILTDHIPPPLPPNAEFNLTSFERKIQLEGSSSPTMISIPGFDRYKCGRCHKGDQLIDKAAVRLQNNIKSLLHDFPDLQSIPLKQYIIQPYADELLDANQFAHATFDTIRVFPRTIIVDEKIYNRSTHLHETFHLTQPFIGYANELEAYAINIKKDPRFLLMNFPYFLDVMGTFFLPEIDTILEKYFSSKILGDSLTPAQVQRFLNFSSKEDLEPIKNSIEKMEPILQEVHRINKKFSLLASYQTSRTMALSLLIDIAAVKLLPDPVIKVTEEIQNKAIVEIAVQMEKTDNTRLGYIIDRKKESMLNLKYKLGINNIADRRALYFLYIKSRFLKEGGVSLETIDKDDFNQFVRGKLDDVEKMLNSKRITPIEKSAGKKFAKKIIEKLQSRP